MQEQWRARISQALFLLLCAETIFAVPYRGVFLATHSPRKAWMVAIFVCVAVMAAYQWASPLTWLRQTAQSEWLKSRHWLRFWLIAGLALRLGWVVLFHVTLKSDGLSYFQSAHLLATEHRYDGAYWPPGFALFLTPFVIVFGPHAWVTVLTTLLFFVAGFWLTYLLAQRLGGGLVSRIAPMIVSVWPNEVALTGINSKELLLGCLITGSLLLYLEPNNGRKPAYWARIAASGLLMGFAALTQPGALLFPAVMIGVEWVRGKAFLPALGRLLLFTFAMVLMVLPWTYRNYLSFHRFVPISTNGGRVFYSANNAKANASYSLEGEEVLPKDEFAADREGYREANEWIRHHPAAFLQLAVRKQIVYLGDDAIGVYESLKRDQLPRPKLYAVTKAVCNVFWLGAWIVLLLGWKDLFRDKDWPMWVGLCLLPLLYQWAIDSVFESGSRHHVPYVPLISVLLGMVLAYPIMFLRTQGDERSSG